MEIVLRGNDSIKNDSINIQNSAFKYKKYQKTVFIPVYPRAHVEEVIGIDQERRTVTARFVILVTINLAVTDSNQNLKKFVRDHLILEFDYNQIIYIPELMRMDNPRFIIEKISENEKEEELYVTYKIRGNIQCYAIFDMMFFPYREIEVINHLVLRSQTYTDSSGSIIEVKYNAMLLKKNEHFHQFSPHIIFPEFAGYTISQSTDVQIDESKYKMKEKFKVNNDIVLYLKQIFYKQSHQQEKQLNLLEITQLIYNLAQSDNQKGSTTNQLQLKELDKLEELSPFKHITFKFDMSSIKIAFVLQNQVPIWALGVVSLYLFTSNADIGNRYGNSILIIVSMIAMLTNFRLNNISLPTISFYEIKVMIVMIVPILLTISTAIDFYSNVNSNLTNFALRSSQIQNPFMLASVIIYSICFAITVIFFFVIGCLSLRKSNSSLKIDKIQQDQNWQNLQQLQWSNPKLMKKMASLLVNNSNCLETAFVDSKQIAKIIATQLESQFKQISNSKISKFQSEICSDTQLLDK